MSFNCGEYAKKHHQEQKTNRLVQVQKLLNMKNKNQTGRRGFISTSLKGSLLLMAGMSSSAMLQSFTPDTFAESEAEFRKKLGMLGNLSLITSQVALDKAVNPKVKMFAKCESDEQKAISAVLKDLNTPMMPLDAKAKAVMDKLNSASGAAFDKAFMQAQHETHQQLKSLTGDFIKNNTSKSAMPEMHTKHIATVSHATITEHTEKSKMILDELA